MCKTLLDLIGTNKREELKQDLLYPTSEAKKSIDTQYALDGSFEEARIPFEGNPVNYSKDPLEVGAIYLDDHYDLNIHIPKAFEIQSVDGGDISVIDMPAIEDVSEQFYLDIIPCNFYAHKDYEFIGMEACPPFTEQEENYLKYVERLQNNGTIFDIFAIFTGEKTSDTPIGIVGAEALNEHFKRNLEKNAVQVGSEYLETSVFRFAQTGNLLRLPYDITVPKSGLGKTALLLEKLSGAYFPFSYLPEDAFNLQNKTDHSPEEYTKILLEYTGKGQKQELQRGMLINKYRPLLIDDDFAVKDNQYVYIGKNAPAPFSDEFNVEYNLQQITDPIFSKTGIENRTTTQIDVFHNPDYGVTSNVSSNQNPELFSEMNQFEFAEDELPLDAIWNRNTENTLNPKSLLYKTKEIVNNGSSVNGSFIDSTDKKFSLREGGGFVTLSKGDNVTAYGDWPEDSDRLDYKVKKGDFFRAWTKDRKYSKLNRAISHRGLDRGIFSVLNNNGIPNIAPTYRSSTGDTLKRYMFSIENLAWNDFISDLLDCEKGDGDPLTGHKGRVMWFPPYDLAFSESASVSWNAHEFIGRGEPVFTYNNTRRSGRLSFTMIVDHPAIVNKLRGRRTEIWERYFKGDKSVLPQIKELIASKLSDNQMVQIKKAQKKQPKPTKVTNEPILDPSQKQEKQLDNDAVDVIQREDAMTFISVYFPNNVSDVPVRSGALTINAGYQSKYQPTELDYTYYRGVKRDKVYEKKTGKLAYPNRTNYELNNDFFDDAKITSQFQTILDEVKARKATTVYFSFIGYASQADPTDTTNYNLSNQRAENLKTWFSKQLVDFKSKNDLGELKLVSDNVTAMSDYLSPDTGDDVDRDNRASVEARRAEIKVEFDVNPSESETVNEITLPEVTITDNLTQDAGLLPSEEFIVEELSPDILASLFTISECDMFEYLEVYDPHSYRTISEKIKYFHPAFHSMTPEGFNGRLNFLHQCTRQSQNIGVDGIDNLTNFAFGRPPVCILRIGDFFHTKIIINNLSIDYEQPKWDLNPEGFVAPMIAKISLDIDFIGGQSLLSPINRLQNALSFNYYASMNMFDPRSDSVYLTSNATTGQLEGNIQDGIRLSQIVSAKSLVVDGVVSDVKASNTSNSPIQKISPVSTPSSQKNVESDINTQTISQLKALLNLPLTAAEKLGI